MRPLPEQPAARRTGAGGSHPRRVAEPRQRGTAAARQTSAPAGFPVAAPRPARQRARQGRRQGTGKPRGRRQQEKRERPPLPGRAGRHAGRKERLHDVFPRGEHFQLGRIHQGQPPHRGGRSARRASGGGSGPLERGAGRQDHRLAPADSISTCPPRQRTTCRWATASCCRNGITRNRSCSPRTAACSPWWRAMRKRSPCPRTCPPPRAACAASSRR